MEANMNGTEILKPLSQVVYNKQYGKSKSTTLNVFLLTDGEVEALPIIDLVKKNNQAETRVYTLGIGEGCSQFLIKRLAEVGNGKYQFVSDNEDINAKVIDLLEDSLTPYLKEFTLQSNVNNIAQIIPNPESVVCLKKNQELTIQVLFSIDQQTDNLQFTLSCFDPQDQKPIKYEVSLNLHTSQENEYFHKLATHKFITFYEDSLNNGENDLNFIKINKQSIDDQDIINTSITHQILSKKTAFVCEVCELEDNFKQQKNQKVYITQNKRENNVQQEMQKCSLSSRQIPLSYMPRSRPMSNCFKKQSCVQEFACKKKLSISKVADPSSEDEEDESKEDIKCTKELKQRKCQKKNYECDKIEAMIQEDSEVRKKEKSRSREKQMRLRGSFHQEEDLPKQQITQVYKIEYEQVISYAKADGAFEYDQMFEQKLNFEGWKNEQNYPQNIWLTLLALLYLDQFCSQNRKSWQLVYQKGIQFLQKNGVNYKQIKEVYLQKQLVQI
ncbi:unnamed protein product [Paramecium octaurelia]|uniref:VWFA domain-containing protein n=1 Tax=Paramecium octaurelia TaxID=43137 RepID=A0A8S1XFL7_PAROT|nr:unnamed protein product [Paramecium octaurelia]